MSFPAAGGEQRHDVRMLQRRGQLNLAIEPVDAHFQREVGRKNFHDDAAGEARLFGHEDAAHAAPAELSLDSVGAAQCGLESFR
jgi:hypothetical protein